MDRSILSNKECDCVRMSSYSKTKEVVSEQDRQRDWGKINEQCAKKIITGSVKRNELELLD